MLSTPLYFSVRFLASPLHASISSNGLSRAAVLTLPGTSPIYDQPPPAPDGVFVSPPPPDNGSSSNWALWKTMTIIFSILGFFLLVIVSFLLPNRCSLAYDSGGA